MRARCPSRLIGYFAAFCRCSAGVLVLCALWPAEAPAQAPKPLPLAGEALTHTRDGAVQGCGVRVTGGQAAARAHSLWLDVSVNVYRQGVALVQAIAYEIQPPRYEPETRPERIAVQRAWIKPEDAAGSTRLGETTEMRDALVYRVTLDDATAVFEALAAGRPLAIGIRGWGRPREAVVGGPVALSDDTRARIADCFSALVN